MSKYYVAGIPFDGENSLKHYGVKGMEWNKHKFGIDADDRYIKWLKNAGQNIGKFGQQTAQNVGQAAKNVGRAATSAARNAGAAVNRGANFVTGAANNAARNVGQYVDRNVTGNTARQNAQTYSKIAQNPNLDSVQKVMYDRAAANEQAKADQSLAGRAGTAVQNVENWGRNAANNVGDFYNNSIFGKTDRAVINGAKDVGDWIGDRARDVGGAVSGAAQNVGQAVTNAGNAVGDWAGQAAQNVGNAAQNVAGGAKGAIDSAGQWVSNAAGNVGQAAKNAGTGAKGFINNAGKWVSNAASNVGSAVSGAANDARNWVGQAAQNVGQAVTNAGNSVGDWGRNAAQNVGQAVTNAGNAVGDWAGQAAQNVGQAVTNAGNWVGDRAQDMSDLYTGQPYADKAAEYRDSQEELKRLGDQTYLLGMNEVSRAGADNNVPLDTVGRTHMGNGVRYWNQAQTQGELADQQENLYNQAPRQKIGSAVSGAMDSVGDWAGNAVQTVGQAGKNAGDWVSNAAQNVGNAVGGAANAVGDWAGQAAQNVRDFVDNGGQRFTYQPGKSTASGTFTEQLIPEQRIPEQLIPEQRIPEQTTRELNPGQQKQVDYWSGIIQNRLDNFDDYYNNLVSLPQYRDYTRQDVMNDLLEQQDYWQNRAYREDMFHSALNDKPEGVSDAFWAKFTADGGTRDDYDRDWR